MRLSGRLRPGVMADPAVTCHRVALGYNWTSAIASTSIYSTSYQHQSSPLHPTTSVRSHWISLALSVTSFPVGVPSRYAWYSLREGRSAPHRRGLSTPWSTTLRASPPPQFSDTLFPKGNVSRRPLRTGRHVTTRRIFVPVSGISMIAADGLLCQPNLPSPRTRMGFGT